MLDIPLIDKIVKLLFVCMPPELILSDEIDETKVPHGRLVELMRCYNREYSDTEADLISQYHLERTKGHNVYLSLTQVAGDLLDVRNNQMCCRYEYMLRWREISREIGEDILACAFLADDFKKNHRNWGNFTWNIVLGHDNKQLNAIMSDGISDNHFHLFGSAPVFPLIWLRMMNDINHGKYMAGLMGIDQSRRHFQYNLSGVKEHFSAQILILHAALMRAVMYDALQEKAFSREYHKKIYEFQEILKSGKRIVNKQENVRKFVQKLRLKTMASDGSLMPDYTLHGSKEPEKYSNWLFSGERKLIYNMLCDILVTNRLPESVQKLLYPYLVIRTWFRKELVQSNDNIGFENFSAYNRRKGYFLPVNATAKEKKIFWQTRERNQNLKWMVQHAVLESFRLKNLRSLEIRITPADDFAANIKQIETYDRLLGTSEDKKETGQYKDGQGILSMHQFYYVYHFAKKKDEAPKDTPCMGCRHRKLRNKLERQVKSIIKMRRLRPEIACRIRGIDACAMEIGCRPEVFACAFRELRRDVPFALDEEIARHVIMKYLGIGAEEYFAELHENVPQLSITYHAGEDFLDPIDGLRALDEALRFLNMGSGDRFGHATVLGLDLKQWYYRKGYCIHLTKQDYLDNAMWFYMMIMEFQVEGCELLKDYLYKEFLETFHDIYLENRKDTEDLRIVEKASIFDYYEAWKLRRDDPDDYKTGKWMPETLMKYGHGMMPSNISKDDRDHKDLLISNLYYLYHFDSKVKEQGNAVIEKSISKIYVQGVVKLQKCMQEKIAQKGIGIEINPSSNLAISTMRTYADHPVLNLYTLGLGDQRNVTQMFVSINTDDRGVFQTSLENEYALLASSVENLTDENGKKLYTPQAVYEWLNHIRVMGNQQVF